MLLVHRSGQLYTWGVGASGRLGLDLSQNGNPQVLLPAQAFTCGLKYHEPQREPVGLLERCYVAVVGIDDELITVIG